MPSFTGKHYYTVDSKGRIIIPAPYREILLTNYSTKLYITNGLFDKCLYLYPLEEWNRHQEFVKSKPRTDEAIEFYMRRVIASATEIEMDKQGRILIPYALREDAHISDEVAIVGQIDRIEIWDKEEWLNLSDPSKVDKKFIKERLASYGF